jgi:hypothetical protein
MRRAFWLATIVIVVAMVVALSAHISTAKSEAFIAAESFLRSSNEVNRLIGSVKEVSLSNTGESFINETGNDGQAKLSLAIVGANESADAEINLARKLRVWHVASANIRVRKEPTVVSLPTEQPAR